MGELLANRGREGERERERAGIIPAVSCISELFYDKITQCQVVSSKSIFLLLKVAIALISMEEKGWIPFYRSSLSLIFSWN